MILTGVEVIIDGYVVWKQTIDTPKNSNNSIYLIISKLS